MTKTLLRTMENTGNGIMFAYGIEADSYEEAKAKALSMLDRDKAELFIEYLENLAEMM